MPRLVNLSVETTPDVDAGVASPSSVCSPRSKTALDVYTKDTFKATCCCPFDNPEAVGYVLASIANGVGVMANIFLSAAILEMANRDAGCGYLHDEDYLEGLEEDEDPPTCKGRVYGQRPANIYILTTTIAALCVAMANPLVGAIIDHTRFRKAVGVGCLAFVTAIQFVQIAIVVPKLWFFVCLLQVPAIVANFINLVVVSAYLPEVATTQEGLNHAASYATLSLFLTEISFVLVVAAVSVAALGSDNIDTAAFSQALCGLVILVTGTVVYGLFLRKRKKPRVSLREAVEVGVQHLVASWKEVSVDFPAVRRLLFGIMFTEAGLNSFPPVASVYIINQLGGSGAELSLVILSLLVVGAALSPAADAASRACGKAWGDEFAAWPLLCATLVYFTVVTAAAPFALRGRRDFPLAFLFGALWGAGMAFYYSLLKPLYYFIIPGGQEAKFSGLFSFFQVIINWAPLLGFSIAYEQTGSLSGGFFVMAAFMGIGGICIFTVDVPAARELVLKSGTLKIRKKAVEGLGEEGGAEVKHATYNPASPTSPRFGGFER